MDNNDQARNNSINGRRRKQATRNKSAAALRIARRDARNQYRTQVRDTSQPRVTSEEKISDDRNDQLD